jgi:hypothetical protein
VRFSVQLPDILVVLQVGLLQEDKVDPEEVARQHTIDWLNR